MTMASFRGTTARDNEGGRMNGGMEVAAQRLLLEAFFGGGPVKSLGVSL